MTAQCSALNWTSRSFPFLPRLRDHCRREGKKTVRVKVVGDYNEKMSSRYNGALVYMNPQWTKPLKLKPEKLPAWRGEDENEDPPPAEELSVIDGYWEMENQFSLRA